MNTMRTYRHTWGRLILSVFVLSWMSVLSLPCVMAMESNAGVNMAMESGHAAHAMNHGDATTPDVDTDCGHCPPAACEAVTSCDVEMSSGCQRDVECSLDSRRAKLILKDAQYDIPMGIAAPIAMSPFVNHKIVAPGNFSVACLPGNQSPLNLLNCVYLI